jgi:two-component SAPR family response regulator
MENPRSRETNKEQPFLAPPFLGRESELSLLKERYARACEYMGNCVAIIGSPGIGKTSLLDTFLSHTGIETLTLQIKLKQHLSHAQDFCAEVIRSCLKKMSRASRIVTRIIDREMYNEFVLSVPELKTYFPYESKTIEIDAAKPNLHGLFYKFIVNMSVMTPIIFVVEDIHIASKDTISLLDYFIQNLRNLPVFLILTSRPSESSARWFNSMHVEYFEPIELSGLSQQDIHELNDRLFDKDLNRQFFAWLHTRTRGNPLFMREFLFTLFKKGILFFSPEDKKWNVIESYTDLPVPNTIAEMISDKYCVLKKSEQHFIKNAALQGIEFNATLPSLKSTPGMLALLEKMGLINKQGVSYMFYHPLIQEVIYDSIDEEERIQGHDRLARIFLERGDRLRAADHFLRAGAKDRRLLDLLFEVSDDMKKRDDIPQAVYYLENAYAIARSITKKVNRILIKSMFQYCQVLNISADYDRSIEVGEAIVKSIKEHPKMLDKQNQSQLYSYLGSAYYQKGRHDDVIRVINRGLRLIAKDKSRNASQIRIELLSFKALAYKSMWQADKALKTALEIKDQFDKMTNPYYLYYVNNILGALHLVMHDPVESIRAREQALDAAKALGNKGFIASAHANLGNGYNNVGEFDRALEHILVFKRYSTETGRMSDQAAAHCFLGSNYYYQGYWTKAEKEYLESIAISSEYGALNDRLNVKKSYSDILLLQGRFEEARLQIDGGIELAKTHKVMLSLFHLCVNKAFLLFSEEKKQGFFAHTEYMAAIFKEKYEKDIIFTVLSGLQTILSGKIKSGLAEVDRGLDRLNEMIPDIFLIRILYLIAIQLRKYPGAKKISEKHMARAAKLAEMNNLKGWLDTLRPEHARSRQAPLRILCFGSLKIEHPVNGWIGPGQWQWAKPKQLFSILLSAAIQDRHLRRDELGVFLWPDLPASKVKNNFHVCLAQLKKAIGREYVIYDRNVYYLNSINVDALEFTGLVKQAEELVAQGKMHMAEERLRRAVDLYRGHFLQDLFDEWLDEPRKHLMSLQRKALFMFGDILMKKMRYEEAVDCAIAVLNNDPLDEEGHRFLMRVYHANGQKAKAVNQFEKYREFLERDLKCSPSKETIELYNKIIS